MKTTKSERNIWEDERAVREVVEKYIAKKVNEERGRRISKGKKVK